MTPSDIDNRIEQSDTELHIGLEIPRATSRQIYNWAQNQPWPEGTELEVPSEYHVTLLYTPEGHEDHKDAWWIEHVEEPIEVRIVGMSAFKSPERGYAYVLLIDSDEVKEKAEEMQGRAESMGLPITRFDGGYKPHITVAYGPTSRLSGVHFPEFQFDIGPSSVSPPRKRESALESPLAFSPKGQISPHGSKAPEPPNYRISTSSDTRFEHCGSCKMFDKGICWGYGNKKVEHDAVCDSWAAESKTAAMDDYGNEIPWWETAKWGELLNAQQIAEHYGLVPSAISNYQKRYPDFPQNIMPENQQWGKLKLFPANEIHRWFQRRGQGRTAPPMALSEPDPTWRGPITEPAITQSEPPGQESPWFGYKRGDPDDIEENPPHGTRLADRQPYNPEEVQILNHLSLSQIAHNLHYRFESHGLNADQAMDYAKRLLKLVGYPDDEITTQAVIQAWQQLYPDDKPMPQIQAPPTVPTESLGYGTTSAEKFAATSGELCYSLPDSFSPIAGSSQTWYTSPDDIRSGERLHARSHRGMGKARGFSPSSSWGLSGSRRGAVRSRQSQEIDGQSTKVFSSCDEQAGGSRDFIPGIRHQHARGKEAYIEHPWDQFMGRWADQGVTFQHRIKPDGSVDFENIDVTPEEFGGPGRGNGLGTQAVQEAKAISDKTGAPHRWMKVTQPGFFDQFDHLYRYPDFRRPNWYHYEYDPGLRTGASESTQCLNCGHTLEGPLDSCPECRSTVPTQVNNPEDHWPEFGDTPPDKKRDVQFSNEFNYR